MQITGLELTLRRINTIESKFQNIGRSFETDNNFETILNKSIDQKAAATDSLSVNKLPEIKHLSDVKSVSSYLGTSKSDINDLISKYSKENNVDENLIRAVVKAESAYNVQAKSPVGAQGLMQLMPATAKNLGVDNPFNPEQNIKGGTKYLKGLLDRFDGNKELALAAYNAGPGAVNKYGGVPPYRETQDYIKKVLGYQKELNNI